MDEQRSNLLENMRICRFCLNDDGNLSSIYDTKINKRHNVPLPLQLMACVAIEVFKNDGMPQFICDACRNLTLQAYSFKANCKKADDALKLFLATGNLTKPFKKSDFQFYLPKGATQLRKVREDNLPFKTVKMEPDHYSDTDSQTTRSESNQDNQLQQQREEEEEFEFSVQKITTTPATPSEPKPSFSCTTCEKTFPLKQLLEIHLKKHEKSEDLVQRHDDEEEDPKNHYPCNYCDEEFANKIDRNIHTRRKHGNKKRPFTCDECGKSFVFKQGLERHLAVHNENRPFKCNYCEASFNSSIKLTRHVTSHAGLRPYPCKLCKRTFLLSHHLTRHMRSHYAANSNNVQNIGQHKCDLCSMSFRRKDSLINHSAIHSMVNLKCVICNTEFESAQAVKEHITTHLSGLPFPCEKCDYSFMTKNQLEEHEVKHAEMEYEEEIEKEVVEEARAMGQVTASSDNDGGDEYEEYGGDHMGRTDNDEDYQLDDDEVASFSICDMNDSLTVRRSERTPKTKEYTDFLKDEIDSDVEEDEYRGDLVNQQTPQPRKPGSVTEESMDVDETVNEIEDDNDMIKPIFRTEGTRVYQRRTPIRRPNILKTIPADKVKTAPLSQINQPQVTTIENLGLTKKDLQNLPTEKFVDMKIGNKTVRVQKLVLTKEEMKAMAKEGKIRGNTVLIKNPGQLSRGDSDTNALMNSLLNDGNEPITRQLTKTYPKKKTNIDGSSSSATSNVTPIVLNDSFKS